MRKGSEEENKTQGGEGEGPGEKIIELSKDGKKEETEEIDEEEEEEEITSHGRELSQKRRKKCQSRVRLSHDQMVDMQERALKVFERCRLEISRMIAETHIKQNTIIKQGKYIYIIVIFHLL